MGEHDEGQAILHEEHEAEDEPCLTYVLPASQLACWVLFGLSVWSDCSVHWWVFFACAFYWSWAVKNRIFGPLWKDLGVFTFIPGMTAGAIEICLGGARVWTTVVCI